MTYDPQRPARERTPFGNFELRRSHLKTPTTRVAFPDEQVTAEQQHAAALTVAEQVPKAEVVHVLDLLGITEPTWKEQS